MARLHGVKVPHVKNTAGVAAVRITPPKTALYPMSQHIGAPSKPVVKVGDEVFVGSPIAEEGGFIGSPIYSGVSGKVKKIEAMLQSNGTYAETVVIESDGEMKAEPSLTPPGIKDFSGFIEAVKKSGVVGLGGAGFPTAVKLGVRDLARIEEIIINGAECEPFITSDTRTMLDRADDIAEGIALLEKYLGAKKIIIGIEKNKPECIKKMKAIADSDSAVSVKALPSLYPQGGEKVFIYNITGKIVKEGQLPIDAGVIVINCTTLATLAAYVRTGMPLVEKCITVDGSAVEKPMNVIAPVGTPVRNVFEFCGGFKKEPAKVLYGGPMMGISIADIDVSPVLKQTNALLAFDRADADEAEATSCIRCGRCTNACPFGLAPVAIAKALADKDTDALAALKVNLCMECGCCSYVCPARRPLVQQNKLAKAALQAHLKAKKLEEEKKKEEKAK